MCNYGQANTTVISLERVLRSSSFGKADNSLFLSDCINVSKLNVRYICKHLASNQRPHKISPECISVISLEKYCAVSLVLHLVNGLECLGHKPFGYY